MKTKYYLGLLNFLTLLLLSSCYSEIEETEALIPLPSQTPMPKPINILMPTNTPQFKFNGYWVSPINKGTNAVIQTYGNTCPASIDPLCIQNWKGDKGIYPEDFMKIMACPYHEFAWDFWWDHQGEKVYAVQGGQVMQIEMESNSTKGVHFFIVDIKPSNWYGANYGHISIDSLVQNQIITQEQSERIKKGEVLDGVFVNQGQFLGVTGDDCCDFGVLHIGTAYGGFSNVDPYELWFKGNDLPDFQEELPPGRNTPEKNCGTLSFIKQQLDLYRTNN